jgi:cold shock CspA family protein/arsenate reductase-like glutaredoxin family protein
MLQGTIKFFQKAKGFGFITPDIGKEEIFLPAAAIAAKDLPMMKPGQRVAFEQVPDGKGPKAASLTLLNDRPQRPAEAVPQARITLLYDPSSSAGNDVLEELRALGHEPRLVDYIASPPEHDELKKLSLKLGGTGQSLVRRYDTLFMALQLDDRFITEGEFWTAISQHPTLINGPVVSTPDKAGVCRTRDDVRSFAGLGRAKEEQKPKVISARLAAMMKGETPPAPPPASMDDVIKAPRTTVEEKKTKVKAASSPGKPATAKRPKAKAVAKPSKKTAAAAARKPAKTVKKKR